MAMRIWRIDPLTEAARNFTSFESSLAGSNEITVFVSSITFGIKCMTDGMSDRANWMFIVVTTDEASLAELSFFADGMLWYSSLIFKM